MRSVAFAVLVVFACSAFASLTPTALTGRVLSANEPLGGVTVTVTSPALPQPRTTTTNADGRYFFPSLPPGRYELTFAKSGHTSLIRGVVVEFGRVARADAALTPSEDEETVTSTVTAVTVTDTTAITTHFSEGELDRLPVLLDRLSAYLLAPGDLGGELLVDDAPFAGFLGFEGVEELTVFRGAFPIELDDPSFGTISARTRSGSEQFTLSVRDTFSKFGANGGHLLESASGGRIVRERLWFFAAGWGGDVLALEGIHGLQFKLTAQPGAAHHLTASWLHSDETVDSFDNRDTNTTLRYTGMFGPRVTADVALHDVDQESLFGFGFDGRVGTGKLSYVAGNHVLTGGATHWNTAFGDTTSFFLGDRWATGRFTINAGVRHEEDERFAPRIAATYDLRGNGRQAIIASWSDHGTDVASLGYATALGNSGIARIDYVRRTVGDIEVDEIQAEARYRLFDRFEAGGTYTRADGNAPVSPDVLHIGRAWAGLQWPIGDHEIGATLLERYEAQEWATDIALRYSVPVSRVGLTLGADVVNAFAAEVFLGPRTWRFWARLRL